MTGKALCFISAVIATSIATCAPPQADNRQAAPEAAPKAERPNILLILADDLGFSDIGAYGGEIPTPNLDRLAAEGVRFARAYNTAKCSPTRAALLTGQYAHRVGLGGTVARPDRPPRPPGPYQGFLAPEAVTIAEALGAAGYGVYMSGKWHAGEAPEHWPTRNGFDRYFGLISGASSYYELRADEPRHRRMALDSEPWTPPPVGPNGEAHFYMTEAISDYALRFLEAHRETRPGDPWFLYLAHTAPHWPLHAPEADLAPFDGTYRDGWDALRSARMERLKRLGLFPGAAPLSTRPSDTPPWRDVEDRAFWEDRMEAHAAMVARMDGEIGRLLQDIEAAGELRNTLVLFLSDNGASHEDITERGLNDPAAPVGAPGSYVAIRHPWAYAVSAPFRGHKLSPYEGGIASPMIAYWPDRLKEPGRIAQDVAHVIDLKPTILDAAGVESKTPMDGSSLTPVITEGRALPARALGFEYGGSAAYREGGWKGVFDKEQGAWALYDVVADPAETSDLAGQHTERLAAMIAAWEQWADDVGAKRVD